MKRHITLLAIGLLSLSTSGFGQTTAPLFTTSVDLNVGNIVAPHLVHGDMWWNPATGLSPIQFPKGVTRQLQGVASILMAGRDAQSQLKSAMQMYRATGSDFWPGPIGTITSDQVNNAQTAAWAKIWRINSTTIDAFLLTSNHTATNTPAEILEWPGKGNIYAKGANGTSITVSTDMAPFVDVNSNGTYEPLSGDYPKMKGSQMLWWVLNDFALKTVSQTNTMMLEMRISAYAYAKGTIADNIVFYEYDLMHATPGGYFDFVFAPMVDFDIHYAFNDYAGFDSARRLAVIYDKDATAAGSRNVAGGYVLLDQPGDSWQHNTPAGAMNYLHNEPSSADSDPKNGLEAYRFMTGYDRLGNKRRANSNYALSGLSADCDANAEGTDQRVLVATAPVTFPAQQNLHFAYAMVAADSAGMCPGINFNPLLATTDTAYKLYWNPSRVTPPNRTNVVTHHGSQLSIFPNPAQQVVNVRGNIAPGASVRVLNALGAIIEPSVMRDASGLLVNVSALPSGIYILQITDGASVETARFVKQ